MASSHRAVLPLFAVGSISLATSLAAGQATVLCSRGLAGAPAGNVSFFSSVSDDGNRVVFQSDANNLVANDTNTTTDIFLFDRTTGQVTRVSVSATGVQANAPSTSPRISGNGRFVVFESSAQNLVDGTPTANTQIFRKDLQTGAVELVSARSSDGRWASGFSFVGGISPDGRWVSFTSQAEDLIATDNNFRLDVFRRDMSAVPTPTNNAMRRVSIANNGQQGLSTHFSSSISDDGNRIAFVSASNNLVTGDTNSAADVFVRDVTASTTTLVSKDSSGAIGNAPSASSWISGNGRYVAFHSRASNLGFDSVGRNNVYVHDLQTLTTTPITPALAESTDPMINADGTVVAFWSVHDGFVTGVPFNTAACYVAVLGGPSITYELVSKDAMNQVGPDSVFPAISANGRFVSFESDATNLVAGDTNMRTDVFVFDRQGGVAPVCLVDFNADGFLNQEDLGGYIGAFLDESVPPGPSGTSTAPCAGAPSPYDTLGYAADYNRDCNFDQEDLGGYITEFFLESENPTNCIPG